jgi:hypothetical protein
MRTLNEHKKQWLIAAAVGVTMMELALTQSCGLESPRDVVLSPTLSPVPQVAASSDMEGARSIITDLPCAPPCWYGIVPGMRIEREEIIRLLETVPNVGTIWEPSWVRVAWHWERVPWERVGYNEIALTTDYRVQMIMLSIDFELTVEELLNKYGLPEITTASVGPIPEDAYVALFLHYPARGLVFVETRLDYLQPVLEPTSRVYSVIYTVPAESAEDWRFGADIHLQPWPGYGPLAEEAYGLHTP